MSFLLTCFCIISSTLIASPQNFTTWSFRYLHVTSACCLHPFLPWAYAVFGGFRYPPSSRQTSHEEGKEWLRSHSTGGLQDTGSQSPLSPPGASCTTTGKYHYCNLRESLVINCDGSISYIIFTGYLFSMCVCVCLVYLPAVNLNELSRGGYPMCLNSKITCTNKPMKCNKRWIPRQQSKMAQMRGMIMIQY